MEQALVPVRIKLREIRVERNLTLTEFHQYLSEKGVSISLPNLSKIDRGIKGASLPKLNEFAKALDRPLESLLDFTEAECTPSN